MAGQRVNLFTEIANDPDFKSLSKERQMKLREDWVWDQLVASGDPRNQKYQQQLIDEAYADVREPEKPSKFWFGGEFFPKSEEYYPRMVEFAGRLGRVWSTPQQMLQSLWREKSLSDLIETGARAIPDIIGAEKGPELKYPYHWYTDPTLLLGPGKAAVKKGLKTTGKIVERLRPPSTSPWLTRLPKGKIPGEIRPLSTVCPPSIQAVPPGIAEIPTGIYRKMMQKLTLHFTKDEARAIADFAGHTIEDPLAIAIREGKTLTEEMIKEINRRVLQKTRTYTKMPTAEAARARIRPPKPEPPSIREVERTGTFQPSPITTAPVEDVTAITISKPKQVVDALKRIIGLR